MNSKQFAKSKARGIIFALKRFPFLEFAKFVLPDFDLWVTRYDVVSFLLRLKIQESVRV